MRILLDYRPALRQRSGVGEYVHGLARALASGGSGDEVAILTTSWKDRPDPDALAELNGVAVIDRRLPVRPLTWAWNRLEWPPVEWLAPAADVVHAQSPLLIPSTTAARVVTIHDLHFLAHPEDGQDQMRRDFPDLAQAHAARADHVVVSSHYAAGQVATRLSLGRDRISVCAPGAPAWAPAIVRARERQGTSQSILFVGTIDRRKNVRGLIEAYGQLRQRRPDAPPLVLAGRVTDACRRDLDRIAELHLSAHVTALGYVSEDDRRRLYEGAALLALPSFEEGFGLPVLEAMACGVPVLVSNRGSLPEVAGDAARPLPPDDIDAIALEMERLLDPDEARASTGLGLDRARCYTWTEAARAARAAYQAALGEHARRNG